MSVLAAAGWQSDWVDVLNTEFMRHAFLAGTLVRVGAARLAAGEGAGPEALRPLYLREADIRAGGR